MYMQVHAAIRADPAAEKKERNKPSEPKRWKEAKLTYDERKEKLKVHSLSDRLPDRAILSEIMLHASATLCSGMRTLYCTCLTAVDVYD